MVFFCGGGGGDKHNRKNDKVNKLSEPVHLLWEEGHQHTPAEHAL